MVKKKNSRCKRADPKFPYHKRFILAVEGAVTERQYFDILNRIIAGVNIKTLKKKDKSSPSQVLKRMRTELSKEPLQELDEAWLVIDNDGREDKELEPLNQWAKQADKHNFALSNPKFEYWLLLHFEDAGAHDSRSCSKALENCLPNFDKSIDHRKFTVENINEAVCRAKRQNQDEQSCHDWPRSTGTTVYKLVESILGL